MSYVRDSVKKISDKPRIGILLVTSNWFRQVGIQDAEGKLSGDIEEIGHEIVSRLTDFLIPVYPGILFSEDSAFKAAKEMKAQDVKALIVSPLMWCEDQVIRAALSELNNLPLLLITFLPWLGLPEYLHYSEMLKGSGAVGSLQFSGMLKREGVSFFSLSGYYKDYNLYQKIKQNIKSITVVEKLKHLKVGILPFPCDQMSTTFVDDFALRFRYGIQTKYLELTRFRETSEKITQEEISAFRQQLEELGYEILVNEEDLKQGIRYSLSVQKIVEDEGILVLAMNDVIGEMHVKFGLRPSLDNRNLSLSDFVVSMEADIAAGLGLFIIKILTGKPALYTEVMGIDIKAGNMLLGHAGYHDSRNADPDNPLLIVNDIEYKTYDKYKGAVTCFKMKPGPVTLVNSVFNNGELKWVVIAGQSMCGAFKLEDTVHLVCEPVIPVLQFIDKSIENGVSQHWLVVPGDYIEDIIILSKWLKINLLLL